MSTDKPWSDLTVKSTPVIADKLAILDSEDSDPDTTNKIITIGTLPVSDTPWTEDHDAAGFALLNLGFLESNAATPATTGFLRAGTGEELNFGITTSEVTLRGDTAEFDIDLAGVAEYVFKATELDTLGNKITGLGAPTINSDATTKQYVDNLIAGVRWKDPARVASTANIDLVTGGLLTIDGVTLVANDRVLVKDQTLGAQNGIYVAVVGSWTRATDADTGTELSQAAIFAQEGTVNADIAFVCTTDGTIIVDTTVLTFVPFTTGALSGGTNITITSNVINFDPTGGVDMLNNNLSMGTGILQFDAATKSIQFNSNVMQLDVPSTGNVDIRVNDIVEYGFSSTQANFNGNNLSEMGILSFTDTNTSIFQSSANLVNDVATGGTHVLRINDSNEYTFNATQADWLGNNLINVGVLQFDDANTDIQQSSTSMQFNIATGGDYLLRINAGVEYNFSATGANFVGNNLINVGFFESNATNPAQSGVMRIGNTEEFKSRNNANDADHIIFRFDSGDNLIFGQTTGSVLSLYETATGGTHALRVNGFTEYSFTATEADWKGNNLINVGFFESNAANPADILTLRVGNTEGIAGRNAANTENLQLIFSSSDTFRFQYDNNGVNVELEANHTAPANGTEIARVNFIDDDSVGARRVYGQIRTVIEDPTAASIDAEMFLSVVKAGTVTDYITLNEANDSRVTVKAILSTDGFPIELSTNMTISPITSDMEFAVTTGNEYRLMINAVEEYSFDAGNADWKTNGIGNLGAIQFSDDVSTSASTREIYGIAGGNLHFNLAAGDSYSLRINDVQEYELTSTQFALNGNTLGLGGGNIQFNDANTTIQQSATDLQYDVATGGSHVFRINNAALVTLAANLVTLAVDTFRLLEGNTTESIELEGDHTTPADGQEVGNIKFIDDSSTGARRTYGRIRSLIEDPTNAAEDGEFFIDVLKNGTTSDFIAINEANDGLVTAKASINIEPGNATSFFTLKSKHTVPADGNQIGRIRFQDDDDGGAVTTYGEIQTKIQSPTNGSESGEMFFQVIKSGAFTDYITINEADDSRVTVKAILSTDGFPIEFTGGMTISPITSDMEFAVTTGNEYRFMINAVEEYSFDSTLANWNGNQIDNVAVITTNATNPSDAANSPFRSGNGEILSWRNAANSNNHYINFDSSDLFRIAVNNVVEYTFGATEADWNGNNLIDLGFISFGSGSADAGNVRLPNAGTIQFEAAPAGNNGVFTYSSDEAFNLSNANASAILQLEANHTTPAGGQQVGQIEFVDDDSTGVRLDYGVIKVNIEDPTNGSEDGEMFFQVVKNGSLQDMIVLNDSNNDQVSIRTGIEFSAHSQPNIDRGHIFSDASGMHINTRTGDSVILSVNGVDEYAFSASQLDMNNNNLDMGSGIISFRTANASIQENASNQLEFDVATGEAFIFRINNVSAFQIDPSGIDVRNNGIFNTDEITFDDLTTSIHQVGTDLTLDVITGGGFDFRINDVVEYVINATQFDLNSHNLANAGIVSFTDTNTSITQSGSNLQSDVATGGNHVYRVNDVNVFTVDGNSLNIVEAVDVVLGTTTGTIIATTTSQKLGLWGTTAVVQPTALTTQDTSITHTAPGTPDFAIQNLTSTSPFGFVTQDEGNTVLQVILNLQTRVQELEDKLQSFGALA